MVCRTIKCQIRARMREMMQSSRRSDDQPYRNLILDNLNKYLLFKTSSSALSWVQRKDAMGLHTMLYNEWLELTKVCAFGVSRVGRE
jgi:hypothetical protein